MLWHKISLIAVVAAGLTLTACQPRKHTAEQKWQQFCKVYESASFTIMGDHQYGVTYQKALEHAQQLPAGQQRDMIAALVKQAHTLPVYEQQRQKEKAMDDFRQGKYQACIDTPHPDIKDD